MSEFTSILNTTLLAYTTEVVKPGIDKAIADYMGLDEAKLNAVKANVEALDALLQANTDGDAITAANIVANIAAIQSQIQSLDVRVVSNLADITAALESHKSAYAAKVVEIEARIDGLVSGASAIDTRVSSLEAAVAAIQSTPTPTVDLTPINTAIATINGDIGTLQAADQFQLAEIDGLKTRVASLEVAKATLEATVAALASRITAVEAGVIEAKAIGEGALTAANQAKAEIATLGTQVSGINTKVWELDANVVRKSDLVSISDWSQMRSVLGL